MNLFALDQLGAPAALAAALVLGLLFGFWLERAGFGSSRKLTAIFYFRDWAVLKVMFSAMAVAGVGLQALALFGLVDTSQLYVPDTQIAAQAIGGTVFGIGFVVGGWCPGTAMAGLGSGKLDALVFLAGAMAGSLAFAWIAPMFEGVQGIGALGTCSISDAIGVEPMTGAIGLLVVALLAFVMAHKVEAHMCNVPEIGGAPKGSDAR
jgi:uncharacterized membrane protein YedE/YeeE